MRWKTLGTIAFLFSRNNHRKNQFCPTMASYFHQSNNSNQVVAVQQSTLETTTSLKSLSDPNNNEVISDEEEEDLIRWEQMYEAGRRQSSPSTTTTAGGSERRLERQKKSSSQIRVVSFDLDNTLWKTSATINAANEALAAFLEGKGVVPKERVEKIMGKLFSNDKSRYCPIDTESFTTPILLSLLRKEAIQHLLENQAGYSLENAVALSREAFDVWVQARHESIASNLAPEVVETLTFISKIKTQIGNPVKICAITDGNANPAMVTCLANFFDLVVNAEQVGVAKPDKRIYLQAAREILPDAQFADLLGDASNGVSWTDDFLENLIGPWWVHVGDDFVKDIVAAKELNMRSIWVRELVAQPAVSTPHESVATLQQRTVQDLVKDVSGLKVIEMAVGAEDYLAQSLQEEFADAVLDKFSDLRQVLFQWHQEGMGLENYHVLALSPRDDRNSQTNPTRQKFCIFCGEKILEQARFCSFCGKGQEMHDS